MERAYNLTLKYKAAKKSDHLAPSLTGALEYCKQNGVDLNETTRMAIFYAFYGWPLEELEKHFKEKDEQRRKE